VSKSATADFDARVSKDTTGTAEHAAILRDAPLKGGAPYTKVKNKILPISRIGEQTFVRSGSAPPVGNSG
jgi:hypothetical protein